MDSLKFKAKIQQRKEITALTTYVVALAQKDSKDTIARFPLVAFPIVTLL